MRLILADDAVLLREGLIRLLEDAGHEVVAATGDAESLIEAVAEHRPEIAVVTSGCRPPTPTRGCARRWRSANAGPRWACWSCRSTWRRRTRPNCSPGSTEGMGYLLKDRVSEVADFLGSLERIREGGTVIDPEVVRQLLARTTHVDPLRTLSERESQVLRQLAAGLHQRRDRHEPPCLPEHGGEARQRHLRQARPARDPHLQQTGAGDPAPPRRITPYVSWAARASR